MEKIRVAIVDDEPRIRRGIERLIKTGIENWEIAGVYSDGQEAYTAIHQLEQPIDVLFTDVQMPLMDGLMLVRELKKENNDFFSIIISGFDDFKYVQTALREGATDYILKPIDRDKFKQLLLNIQEQVIQTRAEREKYEKAEEMLVRLTVERQLQLLNDATSKDSVDLSFLEWFRQFPEGTYYLLYLGVDQILAKKQAVSSEDWKLWDKKIEDLIKETQKSSQYWLWKNSQYAYWVLIKDPDKENIEPECLRLKSAVKRSTPFTISIALSDPFKDLSLLTNVKDELRSALQFRMVQGGNKLFKTESLKHISYNKITEVPPAIYKWAEETVEAMEHGEDKAEQAFNQFFVSLKEASSPFLIQESVRYLCIRIINCWIKEDGLNELPELIQEAFKITEEPSSFEKLKLDTEIWMQKIRDKREAAHNEQGEPVKRAKVWIQEHLEQSITIKQIAAHVHLNATYFCEYFKNQTGETVLDYVTNERLKKAKELLIHTDLKVYDIAAKVGYQDTKYFSRLFKQWTGKRPSEFREMHEYS
ncbi:response regulator [Domibacillus sp. DTU_2020_1001157_1_SI_ALB_TIR_016]|uniref:response regulator transcription factor n=1 Tax=Domibacillus sp. DTU_2020_1001157_1_SI_ALB_TIR_016 TaxID=3077789 RepID=UPI0028E62BB6|nr:response regulator [Domibacillus sp. DTU_2020_1001157_1_SI_ALB_TIR_016]WNS79070.1 response regulator [Domibacillus sp. DTU_2020_1001157_1_SI_ALB_TIR_016]